MRALVQGILITRPHNVAIAAVAVTAGALTGSATILHPSQIFWAAVAAALITAGGNTLNDVADLAVDAVNKPNRPLPSGRLDPKAALVLAIVLFAAGLAATLPLPPACRLIAAASVGLIVFYDLWASGSTLIGNLVVSLLTGTAFLFGSLAAGTGAWGLIPGVFAFFFDLGREVVKDLEDCEADRTGGLTTLPITAGEGVARRTAIAALLILLALLPVPSLAGWLAFPYLPIVLAGVGIPVAIVIAGLRRPREAAVYRRFQIIMKVDMIVGLLAILSG